MRFLEMKKIISSILTVTTLLVLSSCGGSTNNQGTTFTAIGFFTGVEEDALGISAAAVPISTITGESQGSSSDALVGLRVQNNLSGQFIRTTQVKYSYEVPGSSATIPATTSALGVVVGPTVAAEAGGGESSLPSGLSSVASVVTAQVPIIPSAVRAYISLNRGSFPETPFDIIATTSVVGVTSAGDSVETNNLTLFISITPETIVEPEGNTETTADEGESTAPAEGDDGGAVPTEEFLEGEE